MNTYSLIHLSDQVLLLELGALVARDRANTAALLAHIAEVDARKLYLPAACPSMYEYCVQELGLSEDEALTRIRAARTARQHPAVFAALADGRLSLSAVLLLKPCLTGENANELLAAASSKTCAEIREILAERFPRPAVPSSVELIPPASNVPDESPACELELSLATKRVGTEVPRPRVQPLSPERYALQCTISRETHEKLLYAQALLRRKIPSGDLSEVLDGALDALIRSLEKAKFAATTRPRPASERSKAGGRYVPCEVKRAVWERDHGQCAFVGAAGRRCPARTLLEFDHVEAFARGGEATVEGMRLLCRAHNQYAAERTFGVGFMRAKREFAQLAAEERRSRAPSPDPPELDVTPWLRKLGLRADEARRLAENSKVRAGTTLDARLRAALRCVNSGRAPQRGP